ncbi:MAG: Dabb family protein [Myxococcota bacterium]|nr:Dabb family protein [Myxococcota bacterium]
MIRRTVLIKLSPEHAHAQGRAEVERISHELLPQVPGVTSVQVGVPADDSCQESWDVALAVHFDRIEDVEPYRVHPTHIRYRDAIAPMLAVLKAWNFRIG